MKIIGIMTIFRFTIIMSENSQKDYILNIKLQFKLIYLKLQRNIDILKNGK